MLTWKRFKIKYKLKDDLELPNFIGPTIRGGFGNTLRKEVCLRKDQKCKACIVRKTCPYLYIFETPVPSDADIMKKYTSAPHPFVIEPPNLKEKIIPRKEYLKFDLILIGKGLEYLPYFIYTFIRLGQRGFGKNKVRAKLISVEDEGKEIFDPKNKILQDINSPPRFLNFTLHPTPNKYYKVKMSFLTPSNIKNHEKMAEYIDFETLLRSFFRRVVLLEYFHNNGNGIYPFKDVLPLLKDVEVRKSNLSFVKFFRYSTRQKKKIPMKGIVGSIEYEGVRDLFLPYLIAMQDIHVGKNTTFGLGKVIIEGIEDV